MAFFFFYFFRSKKNFCLSKSLQKKGKQPTANLSLIDERKESSGVNLEYTLLQAKRSIKLRAVPAAFEKVSPSERPRLQNGLRMPSWYDALR